MQVKFAVLAVLALAVVAQAKVLGKVSGRDLEFGLDGYTFDEYLKDFGKTVASVEEYALRQQIFLSNVADIQRHNAQRRSYRMAVNKFADRTPQELKRYRGHSTAKALSLREQMTAAPEFHTPVSALPQNVDWRNAKPPVITPVKDQGSCGSCWAHAATEEVESFLSMATGGKLIELSRQNILECTPNPNECGGTGGCEGATAELGMGYVHSKGVATEAAYPYTGADGSCDESIPKAATLSGFVALPTNNYTALLNAIATLGPIAISVDASSWSFYSGGVFDGCDFSNVDIDHAVQLVGYGTDPSDGDYWIVRNSWSADWGEAGYIRLLKHSDGDMKKWCGIDYQPGDGSGCKGGPSQVVTCGTCGIWYDNSYPLGAKLWSN